MIYFNLVEIFKNPLESQAKLSEFIDELENFANLMTLYVSYLLTVIKTGYYSLWFFHLDISYTYIIYNIYL